MGWGAGAGMVNRAGWVDRAGLPRTVRRMKPICAACWIRLYGVFLIVAGLIGYLSNPERAQTALISGGTFGVLAFALGFLAAGGRRWALWATAGLATMLTVVFSIRGLISWRAYLAGNEDKLFAGCLITAMLIASVSILVVVARELRAKAGGVGGAAAGAA